MNWAADYMAGLVNKYGNYQKALSVYNSGNPTAYLDPRFANGQTYNYVRTILSAAGRQPIPATTGPAPTVSQQAPTLHQAVAAPPAPPIPANPLMNPVVQQVVSANDQILGIAPPNFAALTPAATPSANTPAVTKQAPVRQPATVAAKVPAVKIEGNIQGVQDKFLTQLQKAVAAAGGDAIRVTSGFRNPAHNQAVGGVPHSLHTQGLALDGYAHINNQWVPLGAALKSVAPKFGLRSGDQPGFFRGSIDPVHVDFGFNK